MKIEYSGGLATPVSAAPDATRHPALLLPTSKFPLPAAHRTVRLCAAALLLALASAAVRADDAVDIQRLLAAGDSAGALRRADQALTAKPGDADLRFLRAVSLSDQKRDDEALQAYRRLTEDFPELAAPFNNLAVLLAERGQLDAARAALEQALRLDPGNTVSRRNLGDLYLRLAVQAWEQSAQAGRPDAALQRKLQVARELLQDVGPAAGR